MRPVAVELATPRGIVYAGVPAAVEMRANAVLELRSAHEKCVSALGTAQITLRLGTQFFSFTLEKVWASFGEHCFTVLAEVFRPLQERRAS